MNKEDMKYLKGWSLSILITILKGLGLSILIVIAIVAFANADIKLRTGENIQCKVEL